ncbi:622_t:CDS:2, partial [Acaulospora morrowiae]
HIDKYPNAQLIWAQEEPLNSGAWSYVAPRIRTLMNQSKRHEGKAAIPSTRPPSASPATGNKKQHIQEEHNLLSRALMGQVMKPKEVISGVPVWIMDEINLEDSIYSTPTTTTARSTSPLNQGNDISTEH